MYRKISIKAKHSGTLLASGTDGSEVFKLEGNWYFDPAGVNMDALTVTERTYYCPHKGTCFWIDLETPEATVRDVAWVYNTPKPGYERIKDRIGFYPGARAGTLETQE